MKIKRRDLIKTTMAAAGLSPLPEGAAPVQVAGEPPLGFNWRWAVALMHKEPERGNKAADMWKDLHTLNHDPDLSSRKEFGAFTDAIASGDYSGLEEYMKQCWYEWARRNYLTKSAHDAFFHAAQKPGCRIGKVVKDCAATTMVDPGRSWTFIPRGSMEVRQAADDAKEKLIDELDQQASSIWTTALLDNAVYAMVRKREGHPEPQPADTAEEDAAADSLCKFYREQLGIRLPDGKVKELKEAVTRAMAAGKEAAIAEVDELVEATKHYTEEPSNPQALRSYELLKALGLVDEASLAMESGGRLATGRLEAKRQQSEPPRQHGI